MEALYHFIEDSSRLTTLRPPKGFPKDIDSDELIIENLKMEIHMAAFHSAESLFLTVFGHYFCPPLPWFWMSICGQGKFNNIMNLWQESGLEAIIKEPEKWLRDALYPTVNKSNENYNRSRQSAMFAKDYLDRLANEYMKHGDYNAYTSLRQSLHPESQARSKMGHGAICSNKKCSHRLGLHQYNNKKRTFICTKCRCDKYK